MPQMTVDNVYWFLDLFVDLGITVWIDFHVFEVASNGGGIYGTGDVAWVISDSELHVFSDGCEEIEQMLLFRDRLRQHAEDRLLYEETKRELAARTWRYTQNYADAKSEVVQEILARARVNKSR